VSALGLAFYLVFGGNLLLEWGLPGCKAVKPGRSIQNAALIMVIAILSTLFNGTIFRHILMPFGLETLIPLVFALILFGFHTVLSFLYKFTEKSGVPLTGITDMVLPMSLVLYAAAMSTARGVGSPYFLILGGFSATLGYLAASVLLDDITTRLELEPVPEAFRGIPIRFMSAGLIALTFAGIEAAFLMNVS
jgi:electron transport complex protein RnfA